jgi:hypothetical protein
MDDNTSLVTFNLDLKLRATRNKMPNFRFKIFKLKIRMKSSIKYILLFVAISFSSLAIKAQTEKSGEAAVQIGGNYYLGDLNHFPFKGTRPAVGIFYRHNFNSRYSIKGLGYGGLLTGKGKSPDGLSHSFSKFYGQLDAIGEFNFTPFIVGKKNSIYTTYLQAGAGILYYPSADIMSSLNLTYPWVWV